MSSKKSIKKHAPQPITLGCILTIIVIVAATVIYLLSSKQEVEAFPNFQDVKGNITTQVGDYKLEKQAYLGDPDAPIKVIEFIDYKCPYCAAWNNDNFTEFKSRFIDTGKVQLFVVNFPFLGPDSIKASMVGEILWKQSPEAFWEYHHALYANQGDESKLWANEKYLLDIVKKHVSQIDIERIRQSLKELDGLYEVKEDFKITTTNGVSSVPTFIINGEKYENPDLEQLSQIIKQNELQ